MMFEFPALLVLVPILAGLGGGLAMLARRRRVRLARHWSVKLAKLARDNGRWSPAALALVGALAGIAIAGPRGGRIEIASETRALSLIMSIDISRSMLAEDVVPSRLGRAVKEARRLIQDLEGDRLGLTVFAGRSYILAPLTVDGSAIVLHLDALDPDIASQGGTSLPAALRQGAQLLGAAPSVSDRVLVVFSDGETHDSLSEALAAAREIRELGVRLILVGEREAAPSRIPIRDSRGTLLEYKRDDEGNLVETARRDDVLRALAEASGGTVVPADVPDQAGAIRDLVGAFKRMPTSETRTADLRPLAWIPLLAAMLLLLGQTASRRSASLITLVGLLLTPGVSAGQRPSPGVRAMADGRPERAATAFLEEAKEGSAVDTAFYNAGTAALVAGRLEPARAALTQAGNSVDPALRYRALYNAGVAAIQQAQLDSAGRDSLLDIAAASLKQALLLQPASQRAKWNLELTMRDRNPPPSGGGGGGGTPPPQGGGQSEQAPNPPPPESGSLTEAQAEQILNSVEREERETRAQQLRRLRGGGIPGRKDW